LHASYAEISEENKITYLAAYQDTSTTEFRIAKGECYLAFLNELLVGTITLYRPREMLGSPWYDQEDVSSFGQFGVLPEYRGLGIGGYLLDFVERRAKQWGLRELALDTAEPATQSIRKYNARGYRFIETMKWPHDKHQSVILSKTL
jgi:GNAT superfamily N-acetyltransferase